jgi:hypothetical protein
MKKNFKAPFIALIIAFCFWFFALYLLWYEKNGKLISGMTLIIIIAAFSSTIINLRKQNKKSIIK